MKLVPLNEIFDIEYGNKFDANKLTFADDGINFVSRSSKNLGIVGRVEAIEDAEAYPSGLITVTLGGTYLLSAFVQPEPFYTAQNIKVLRPKLSMTDAEKAYYCECIRANRFKYSTHGREANRSLDYLLVPQRKDTPTWLAKVGSKEFKVREDHSNKPTEPPKGKFSSLVRLDALFDLRAGASIPAQARSDFRASEDYLPLIRPSKTQMTSTVEFADTTKIGAENIYPRHSLYVSTNGQGSHTYAYVSTEAFVPNSDVTVLIPFREMSLQEKLFYAAAVTMNRPYFSYGRKPKGERLAKVLVPECAPKFVYEKDLITNIAAQ